MNAPNVKKVVIAGGGTAGWIAAVALSKQLGSLLDIVLVESDEIGTVGVGESTIPTTTTFHRLMGIDEQDFMRATGATFKLGISFENWGDIGDRYIHSFGQIGKSTWMGDFHHFWLQAREEGFGGDLDDYCFELQAAKHDKFATAENASINYAYHLDATRYAKYLRQISESQGVARIEGKIASVTQNPESGDIVALVLENGKTVGGDLFIDCTGFRGLLIEQTLQTGYEDWSHWLPTNSAFAVQTVSTGPAVPYTRAMAHGAGWQWRIPLQHRVGNGLVFCSDHLSDDVAHDTLLAQVEGEVLTEPRLIRYQTGQRRKAWNKNCVALGLASGFVEPLESTSIHLVMIGITRLMQMFPFDGCNEALSDRYNELARGEVERIRDFIILHYNLSERSDTDFWHRMRTLDLPSSLSDRIALFRDNAHVYQAPDEIFRADSWVQVMLGQRLQPSSYHHVARLMPKDRLKQSLGDLKNNINAAVANMPQHEDFIGKYCAAPAE